MTKPLRVAIAGLGTVGGGVVKVLTARRAELAARAGREIECVLVSARDAKKKRAADIGNIPWTDDVASLAAGDADVVVELIGGEDGVARTLVERALEGRQACRDREQGAARLSWRRACGARGRKGRGAAFRSARPPAASRSSKRCARV